MGFVLLLAFELFAVVTVVSAENFNCPQNPITISDGATGAIPSGATSMVHVPANNNCTFTFEVPKGYAIKMETSTVYDVSPGDFVRFDYFYIISGSYEDVEWFVGSELNVTLVSITGNMTFFAKYDYVDLRNYLQIVKPTGTYFNSTLAPNHFYTIRAADGDQVSFKTASRDTGFYDHTVYEDIGTNTTYRFFVNWHTLTFLNLYMTPSDTFIIGNDFSKVKGYDEYHVIVVDSVKNTSGYMYNEENQNTDAYYTFICDTCSNFYIDVLDFSSGKDASGYVEIRGMSPTQDMQPVLNYTFSYFTNMSLPQLIPAPMATFHSYRASIAYVLNSNLQSQWLATTLDHKRSVFSPKLWNPDADQTFDFKFSDAVQVYNFSIELDSIDLVNDGDELSVKVGSVDGLTTLNENYTKTSMSSVHISGIGRYLSLSYTGTKTSQIVLNFEMIDPAPIASSSSPVTGFTISTGTPLTTNALTQTSGTAPSTTVANTPSPSTAFTKLSTLSAKLDNYKHGGHYASTNFYVVDTSSDINANRNTSIN
ncbi:unnamed protein product [Caenorhabditis sp. 36 PRJEB53466]|nr:unnamed protein product [Caenorhabditis sp. 36 PRJEB53466]